MLAIGLFLWPICIMVVTKLGLNFGKRFPTSKTRIGQELKKWQIKIILSKMGAPHQFRTIATKIAFLTWPYLGKVPAPTKAKFQNRQRRTRQYE